MPHLRSEEPDPQLPNAPSLKSELIKRAIPGAAMFPDHEVESYSIDDSRLSITFKRAFEIALEGGVKIRMAKQVQAQLIEFGLVAIEGVSAVKKLFICEAQAKITAVRLEAGRLIVATDNALLPEIKLDAGAIK